MARRVALLIGTGEYTEGLKPLPAAPKDVEAIAAVLRNPEMGGFDDVKTLINEPYTIIAETIEIWFQEQQKEDLALLYVSGHGVKDAQLDLYFAACNTRKQKEALVRSTAVAASFVRDRIRDSKAKRQIIILDCCFSGAFGDLLSKDDDMINLETLLGAEGRVVLTSSSSIQYSFEQRDGELSIYTHYLVEGIRTGAADIDGDGAISVQELHQYASRKVQEESPAMTPKIIVLKDEGYQIRIAKAPLGDPKVKYRKEVEEIVQEDGDEIDKVLSRPILEEWQRKLGLTDADVHIIEAEILEPIRQRQVKIQRYREIFTRALQHKNSLGEWERKRLKQLQHVLGLLDENVQAIETEVIPVSLAIENEDLLRKVQVLKDEIDFISSKIEQATRDYDLNLAAEWTYGRLDKLKLELQPLEAEIVRREQTSGQVDDLSSEKGIDYTRLRDLLRTCSWREADHETYIVMLRAIEKKDGDHISNEELWHFPLKDLRTVNRLWINYSNRNFGFSIQKEIYFAIGGSVDDCHRGEIWEKFGDYVKWRVEDIWLEDSDIRFSTYAPKGHLPWKIWRSRGWVLGDLISYDF